MHGTVNIVGGGIAGLVAAAELARAGMKVVLFEAAGETGGRARTRHIDGFSLNQGPHAVYIEGEFLRTLTRLGISVPGQKSRPEKPMGLYRGKLARLPTSAASLAATKLFGLRDKTQFVRVQKAILDGATSDGSFASWLDAQNLRPAVRAGLEGIARVSTYANAPERISAAAALEQIRFGLAGVIYVDGGWGTLIEQLAKVVVEAGAEIRTGARVASVAADRAGWRAILAEGAEHAADATLLALGPHEAVALAPACATLKRLAAEAVPMRANTLDLALDRFPKGAADFVLGLDRPLYFSLHSRAAKLAPDGGAVVHVARYLTPDEHPAGDAIVELEQFADMAMPGWRDLERNRRTLIGITVAHAMPRHDLARPDAALADAPGLFIAGDWVGSRGMISDCAAASGVAAAKAIMKRLTRQAVRLAERVPG